MYRNSAQLNCLVKPSLQSPENPGDCDSDSDLIDALEQKRKQLDDEISKFKALKDREFRDFEKDLRMQCKRKRSRGSSTSSEPSPPGKYAGASVSSASVLNLLASTHNGSANGWSSQKPKRGVDNIVGDKIIRPAPLSKPTLSLDKLNISGETTPPTSIFGTPPTPSAINRSMISRCQSASLTTFTHPQCSHPAKPEPTTPATDHLDPFAGVFTPSYLPLLESHDHKLAVQSPQPLELQAEADAKQLQLINAESKRDAEMQNGKSQSLPQQPVSPTVLATKRTHSTPQLPSTSLPSALRNSSGRRSGGTGGGSSAERKRKHVTFQLADSAIVDPSSSYEEMPSPEPRNSSGTEREFGIFLNDTEEVKDTENWHTHAIQRNDSSDTQQVQNTGNESNSLSPKASNQRKARLRSPAVSPLPSPSPSPTINGLAPSTDESGFSGDLVASVDGGSGVGFFELDEELASPAFTEDRSFDLVRVESEDRSRVDDDLLLDEKKRGGTLLDGDVQAGGFAVGSVPINIVRHPTGSWMGSYGH
ncbi:uncharacterized protein A1O9_04440 [Exophiala aquamarina CBS 119918]|uniref:Uncharacterized protein n=1 Tax=Exophiala aquamarina CBS 119918 TaxID=1182545 RepID=A0A072PHH2_9EURO|nr:uncharacterized protein A1O9_04440 [Exophiala aquamarina CBS 119918]KEF59594.1 hypothetical protein A1O9_04440 [Exophiala aquamarina CBS 119918]